MNINLFWQITKRSYQRYLTYRAATLAGLVTNFFFGILRASILVALYGTQTEVQGISINGAITYAAMTQAVIGYLSLFSWFDLMVTVYTGEIATDLLKPISYVGFWMAKDLGRAIVQLIFRGFTVMAGYALIFDLTWPQGLDQWWALCATLIFSWMISFLWRFLVNLASFWTPQAIGVLRLFFTLSWFFSGFLMPLRFFPDWVVKISYLTPFPHMLNTVVEVYLGVLQGSELLQAIALQILWIIALLLAAQVTLRAGVRRLVILGG
jgi:ABC-2 type transport system permease protein